MPRGKEEKGISPIFPLFFLPGSAAGAKAKIIDESSLLEDTISLNFAGYLAVVYRCAASTVPRGLAGAATYYAVRTTRP